jgi:hypothetical protein
MFRGIASSPTWARNLSPFNIYASFSRMLSKNVKIKICKTIILPLHLYGLKTWSLTLREEHRLRVFQKRVLKEIFKPQRDEVTEG